MQTFVSSSLNVCLQIYVALPLLLYVAERIWRLLRNFAFKGELLDIELIPGKGRVTVLRMRKPIDFSYRQAAWRACCWYVQNDSMVASAACLALISDTISDTYHQTDSRCTGPACTCSSTSLPSRRWSGTHSVRPAFEPATDSSFHRSQNDAFQCVQDLLCCLVPQHSA